MRMQTRWQNGETGLQWKGGVTFETARKAHAGPGVREYEIKQ